jgi:hypothetical protein
MSELPGLATAPASAGSYQVLYGPSLGALVDMGLVDDVDPTKSKMKFRPITTGSTGKGNKLGDRFIGADVVVSIQFRQITLAMLQALCPWSTGTPVELQPPLNADMYTYSQPLVLHPLEQLAGTTLDRVFLHAVPMNTPDLKRDGGADDVITIEFACYPDRPSMQTSNGSNTVISYIKGT